MLDTETRSYLDTIADQLDRSRSWVITQIVKKHKDRAERDTKTAVANPPKTVLMQ